MYAPIALFVYNRPEHTRRTLEALKHNEGASESTLHVFADGPKPEAPEEGIRRIDETRNLVRNITGFAHVELHFAEQNKGCFRNVVDGITEVLRTNSRVIVVEDDIKTIPQFLSYMNHALNVYEQRKDIWTIGGMNVDIKLPEKYTDKHDLYLVHRSCSWGWATWANRWSNIDWAVRDADEFFSNRRKMLRFERGGEGMCQMLKDQLDGKIDAWDIVWDYHIYKHNGYCLRPAKSFTRNIGMDGSGTHYNEEGPADAQAALFDPSKDTLRLEPHLHPNREVQRLFYNYWADHPQLPFSTIIKQRVKKVLRNWGLMKRPL